MRNFISPKSTKKQGLLSRQAREQLKDLSPSDRFKVIVEEKRIELEKQMMLEKRNPALKDKPLSDKAQKVVQAMAEDKARQALKKMENEIAMKSEIKRMKVNGGRIEADGKVYNDAGKQVAQIDPISGKIAAGWLTHGKYKPDSMFSKQKIEKIISKSNEGPTSFTGQKIDSNSTGFWGVGAPKNDGDSGGWW